MNCKIGLAIFVRSKAGNLGRIVTCIRLATEAEKLEAQMYLDSPVWLLDQIVPFVCYRSGVPRKSQPFAYDFQLRPINNPGEDAQDETLAWKTVPSKDKEPA